jgi:hypothetical protein
MAARLCLADCFCGEERRLLLHGLQQGRTHTHLKYYSHQQCECAINLMIDPHPPQKKKPLLSLKISVKSK